MAVDNPQEMIGSQLCDNKSLHLTPLRSAGEFRVPRDPVARNRGADFVEHLVPSHYVRRNKVLDLTPRRR